MDPRVKTPSADLVQQFKLSKELYDHWLTLAMATEKISAIRTQLSELRATAKEAELRTQIDAVNEKLQSLAGGGENRRPDPASRLNVASATTRLRTLLNILQEVDAAPTPQATAAIADLAKDLQSLRERWQAIRAEEISALNQKVKAAGLAIIDVPQ
jgi:predicted NACHT family NTPase